jgi:hypothetical protein
LDAGESGGDFMVRDCRANLDYLTRVMEKFGLAEHWAYRGAMTGEWAGLSDVSRREVISTADLLLNISSTLVRPEEYRRVPRKAFINYDPVFTQIKIARGRGVVDAHDIHFSFGECMREPWVAATGHMPRQPIVTECPPRPGAILPRGEGPFAFTSVEESVHAIRRIESDYRRHSIAARRIEEEYFDSSRVLERLIETSRCSKLGEA